MATHVLMINPQLSFTVSLKQALERTGSFDVHPFTTVDAALDYLRDHPQDVALIDFRLPGIAGEALVRELRVIQPDIAVIVSPQQPDDMVNSLQIQDTLNTPFNAREIIPRLNRAVLARTMIVVDEEDTPHSEGRETRLLPQDDEPPKSTQLHMPGTTRRLSDPDEEDGSSKPQGASIRKRPDPGATRILNEPDYGEEVSENTPPPPPDVPEFSNLDNVLRSMSDPAQPFAEPKPRDPFHDLVQSMRGDEPRKPLPERTQGLIDFTLPTDPERTRGMTLKPSDGETVFRRLADEEPPMPTLEESGTVGDLITGIGDSGFRNVLAILRGEDPPTPETQEPALSPEEVEEAITALFSAEADLPQGSEFANAFDESYRDFSAADEEDDEEEDTPAKLILETALDESTPLESFSLVDLIQSIEQKLPEFRPNVQPLPSWMLDFEPLVREPDFLPEEIPAEATGDYADHTTQPHVPPVPVGDFETEQMPEPERTQPIGLPEIPMSWDFEPETVPEDTPTILVDDVAAALEDSAQVEIIPAETEETPLELDAEWLDAQWPDADSGKLISLEEYDLDPEMFQQAFERYAPFEQVENEEYTPTLGVAPVEDPQIAQFALGLTQLSLETTAEATLLTRQGEIIAYAGQLTREDLNELRAAIDDDWDTTVEEARVRFITLHDSGREFMLYSRQTDDGLTLSMIFAGTTPLRDIRRQGKRLVEALHAVPETPQEAPPPPPIVIPEAPPSPESRTTERVPAPAVVPEPAVAAQSAMIITPPDVGTLTPYACAWILRDANARLEDATAQAIMAGLRTQLHERGWKVRIVHAQNEFVYLLADVPESLPVKEMIRDLKRRSADITRALEPNVQPDSLWADAYLMVTPGRELEMDEIQGFISFERM